MELVDLCVIHAAGLVSHVVLATHVVHADLNANLVVLAALANRVVLVVPVCSFHCLVPPVIVASANRKKVSVSDQNQDHLAHLHLVVYVVVHVILVVVVHVVRVGVVPVVHAVHVVHVVHVILVIHVVLVEHPVSCQM